MANSLQERFSHLLPRIELHGRIYFRHVRCPHLKADSIQEMRCLAWLWFLRLMQNGKDPAEFVMAFVSFLARAVHSGRRIAGMNKSQDVMNPAAQKRHGFRIESLPQTTRAPYEQLYTLHYQMLHDAFEERLRDNTITPVPDQVQFRIDFASWLQSLTVRERRIIRAMARNERTKDISRQFDVSPGRISQMRREFHDDWHAFRGEPCAVTARR
jgi:hypothetical protein